MVTHRQIEAFRAVMLARNFTAAGQMLNVTQGAVSKIIADLERGVGFALFSRRKGGIEPTPQARALLEEVENSYHGLERIQRSADRIRNGQNGSLRVGSIPALSTGFAQGVLAEFLRGDRSISIKLDTYNSAEVVDLVSGGFCDVGFAMTPVASPGIEILKVLEVPCVAILPSDHPLLVHNELKLADFAGSDFISLGDNTTTRLKINAGFNAANVKRRLEIETRWSASVCGFVAQGFGVSIIEPFTAGALRGMGFEVRPLAETITFSFAAIVPRHKVLSSLAAEFSELLMVRAAGFSTQSASLPTPAPLSREAEARLDAALRPTSSSTSGVLAGRHDGSSEVPTV
jgi:DNA-binding transcriptional LysR family regulator